MTLSAAEFLQRYVQHVLPHGFVRIRQFGFLANRLRAAALTSIRQLLLHEPKLNTRTVSMPAAATWNCPRCGACMQIGCRLTAQELAFRWTPFDTS